MCMWVMHLGTKRILFEAHGPLSILLIDCGDEAEPAWLFLSVFVPVDLRSLPRDMLACYVYIGYVWSYMADTHRQIWKGRSSKFNLIIPDKVLSNA